MRQKALPGGLGGGHSVGHVLTHLIPFTLASFNPSLISTCLDSRFSTALRPDLSLNVLCLMHFACISASIVFTRSSLPLPARPKSAHRLMPQEFEAVSPACGPPSLAFSGLSCGVSSARQASGYRR